MRLCLLVAASLSALLAEEAALPAPTTIPVSRTQTSNTAQVVFIRILAQAPSIQAAQERILAFRGAARAAGRLPDPMLSGGYARTSNSSDRWPVYGAMLEQPLPRWGEHDAIRAKAAAELTMSEAELQDHLGETAAEIATMLAEADAARAKLTVVDGQMTRAKAIQATIAARVAAGTASLADQLGVRSRLAALQVERDTMSRMVKDAEQDVLGQLGLPPTASLPPFFAPDRTMVMLARVPGILMADAKGAEAEAMFDEARATRYPETVVGLRFEREREPGNSMKTIGVTFSVSLPVWQGASADLEEAAVAHRRAARREAANWQFRAQAVLGRAERASAVAASARAAAQDTKTRLDTEYDAMIRAASINGGTNLISILDVVDRLSDAERMVIDAEAAARQAEASLWRLAPPDLSTIPSDRTLP